jgi:hypothetical protein
MSVTFTIEQQTSDFVIVCSCGEKELSRRFTSYEESAVAILSTANTCSDEFCAAWPARISAVDEEEFMLNVSGSNACFIFDALGIMDEDDREVGSLPADDFLGRVLMAEAIAPVDEGVPAFTEGVVTYQGRPDGYLGAKLTELRQIASEALATDALVIWS